MYFCAFEAVKKNEIFLLQHFTSEVYLYFVGFHFSLGVGYVLAGELPALASAVEPAGRTPLAPGLVRAGAAAAGRTLPSRLCSGSPALSAGGPARSTHTLPGSSTARSSSCNTAFTLPLSGELARRHKSSRAWRNDTSRAQQTGFSSATLQ